MNIKEVKHQAVIQDIFQKTQDIINEKTSSNFGEIALNKMRQELSKDFKFMKDVHIGKKTVEVDTVVNSIDKVEFQNFFNKVMDLAGQNYLKNLLIKRLKSRSLNYLNEIGLKFN